MCELSPTAPEQVLEPGINGHPEPLRFGLSGSEMSKMIPLPAQAPAPACVGNTLNDTCRAERSPIS
jgi:hypothetical protein